VRVWSAKGELLAILKDNVVDGVNSAVWSPDGTIIVTAAPEPTFYQEPFGVQFYGTKAQVWSAEGQRLATLQGPKDTVLSAAWSPKPPSADGSVSILTASANSTVHLWRVFTTVQTLVNAAKARAPRCLTQAQRRAYFLPRVPPRWCITGAGFEAETDPNKWQPKWPYHTPAWRDWLIPRDRGEDPPLPADSS
jgi:hypothetical protein